MQGKFTIGFGPILLIGFVVLSSSLSRANSADEGGNESSGVTPQELRYTFSWNFDTESDLRPRGGTTTGADVTLAASPSESWKALQKPYQSKFEKDRSAILAMAGEYRASFDFIETLGFYEDHKPTRPYQSWGTEYIFVVEDRRDFISLQHVLVMMMKTPEGGVTEPYVVKHWRQDWTYEDSSINRYVGNRTWRSEEVPKKQRQGNWSQAVFQVDDSPRYESMGRWVHAKGFSSWMSQETWRPLPRREFSVRDDYDVLIGTNRHTITLNGWSQEEDNLKVVIGESGDSANGGKLLPDYEVRGREVGFNRYERIIDFDFQPAKRYWDKTAYFWSTVRGRWGSIIENRTTHSLTNEGRNSFLMGAMIAADTISKAGELSKKDQVEMVNELFDNYVVVGPKVQ